MKIMVFNIKRLFCSIEFATESLIWTVTQKNNDKYSMWLYIGPVKRDDIIAFMIVIGPLKLMFAIA